ncbi:MAG: FkbM family methyltransferase [Methanomassiliicoccus sp.]|nr:FkbM family methyltransferase [Methanomassiliicoccus sp.]
MTLRKRLNKMITGMPFERSVRNFYSLVYSYYTHNPNFYYDRQAHKIMSRVLGKNSNCIDIGANEGMILKDMLKFAPRGEHMAIEPIPDLADRLTQRYPQVEVHKCALSNACGTSSFQLVTNNPGYSGLRRRHYDFGKPEIKEITVRTKTMDEVYPEGRSLDFVKIDVEGAEYLVLEGGKETLKRNQPYIVFEHGRGAAEFYDVRPEQVYDLLVDEIGLQVSVMKDWLDGKPSLSKADFVDQFEQVTNYYFLAHP